MTSHVSHIGHMMSCANPDICRPIKIDLCLASVNGYQVFTKYFSTLERWIGCKLLIFLGVSYGLDYRVVLPFSKVFHSLTKGTIIYELEKVFLKSFFALARRAVFISIYGFIHAFWSNDITL